MERIVSAMAFILQPAPPSLPKDQKTTQGWFLSRCTSARALSTCADIHSGLSPRTLLPKP